jgi:uncharacterized protein YqjF (DUF2071 family)
MSNPKLTSPSDIFCGGVVWRVAHHRLQRFFGFGIERVVGQVIDVEMRFDRLEIRRASRDDSGSVSNATELKVFLTTLFSCFATEEVSGRR